MADRSAIRSGRATRVRKSSSSASGAAGARFQRLPGGCVPQWRGGGTCAIFDLTVEASDRTRSGINVCSAISACLRYLPVLAGNHRTFPYDALFARR